MKTLKFMLAAATAIGLASATQAAQNKQASTGFEKWAQDTNVGTSLADPDDNNYYFYYTGSTAEDNESRIVAGAPSGVQRPTGVSRFTGADLTSQANVLQVSTGTDPLLRTFAPLKGSEPQAAEEITEDTYVDTLVQFTVTPCTDNVTPGSSDKLMIYLKEMTNSVGEVTGTNLVVVGGYYDESASEKLIAKEYAINAQVSPNVWYRLTVQAIPNLAKGGLLAGVRKYPAFKVYLNGTVCQLDGQTIADNDSTKNFFLLGDYWDDIANQHNVVISMCAASDGTVAASLQAVGFAGEGYVDDLVVTTSDPSNANLVDFTFDISGEGVGAVSFTVNGGSAESSGGTYEVSIGDRISVTAEAQSGYELIEPTTNGLAYVSGDFASTVYEVTGMASLTINAQVAAAPADWVDDPTGIADNTPAATQYPSLDGTALATADAKKLTVWATKVAHVDFSDAVADADDYVEAFLLNCAVADVDDEKDDFTLTITINASGEPVVQSPVDRGEKTYNGTVVIKGATTLDGTYENPAPSGAKFFKAELSLE